MKILSTIVVTSAALSIAGIAISPNAARAATCDMHRSNIFYYESDYHSHNDRDDDGVACESGSQFSGTDHWVSRRRRQEQQTRSPQPSYSYILPNEAPNSITVAQNGTYNSVGRRVCPVAYDKYPVMATRITTTYRWGEVIGNLVRCGTVISRDITNTHVDIETPEGWAYRVDATAIQLAP